VDIHSVALILGVVAVLVMLGVQLNRYSEWHYDYSPINLATVGLVLIPYILLVIGFIMTDDDPEQLRMALYYAGGSLILLFGWLIYRSSFWVAVGAVILLLIIGAPALLWLLFSGDREVCYIDDD